MPCPPHSPWLDLPNVWGWAVWKKLILICCFYHSLNCTAENV
jgi:hypothetical protein